MVIDFKQMHCVQCKLFNGKEVYLCWGSFLVLCAATSIWHHCLNSEELVDWAFSLFFSWLEVGKLQVTTSSRTRHELSFHRLRTVHTLSKSLEMFYCDCFTAATCQRWITRMPSFTHTHMPGSSTFSWNIHIRPSRHMPIGSSYTWWPVEQALIIFVVWECIKRIHPPLLAVSLSWVSIFACFPCYALYRTCCYPWGGHHLLCCSEWQSLLWL